MRLRFSLRTFLTVIAVVAALCYCWFVLPYVKANRFLAAVEAEDYQAADELFRNPDERVIANWAETYWAFRPRVVLQPPTLGELLTGKRHVDLFCTYFYLDEHVTSQTRIAATPFGLKRQAVSTTRSALIIDREAAVMPKR